MSIANLIKNAQAKAEATLATNATLTNPTKENNMNATATTSTNEETTMNLSELTMKDLIALYNTKATKERKSFKNKADAISAIKEFDQVAKTNKETIVTKEENEVIIETKKQDLNGFNDINENSLSSMIAAKVFLLTQKPMESLLIACAATKAVSMMRTTGAEDEAFGEFALECAEGAQLNTVHNEPGVLAKALKEAKRLAKAEGRYYIATKEEKEAIQREKGQRTQNSYEVVVDEEMLCKTLGKLKMLNKDGTMGKVLIEMLEQRREGYAPVKGGVHQGHTSKLGNPSFKRKFPLMGLERGQLDKSSTLAVECLVAQEKSLYSTDKYMLDVANAVQPILDRLGFKDDEAYVLAGCNAMDSNAPYSSEFKFDPRLRSYLACCFGPNGQSSDRSRALMNLFGVKYTKEQIPTIVKNIMAEVEDMTKLRGQELQDHLDAAVESPVDFAVPQLQMRKSHRPVVKVWSFIKAAYILAELAKGNMPEIGMAVGLDAKCSGPQLGSLMAGDANIAAACGFSLDQSIADAYERCIQILDDNGFAGMSRGGIKKTFMGVFYGQGFRAFTNTAQLLKDDQDELVEMLLDGGTFVSEERAKKFHKLVTSSFGRDMVYIRNQVLKYEIDGRMGHFMPDGARVQMNYKVQYNVLNERVDNETICPDVIISINGTEYKFISLALNSKEVHHEDFVRTAFVNMIQATDALLARLIVVHLSRLGAQHIVAVHDCFRVNVTETHLLEKAIKLAYLNLFGTSKDIETEDLPMGQNILKMFFEGLDAARAPAGEDDEQKLIQPVSQFTKGGHRIFQKCNNVYVHELIHRLGETFYFAK